MKISRGGRLVILAVALIVVDQTIKCLVKTGMTPGEQIYVLGDWFRLCFIENEGMAYGLKLGGVFGKMLLSLFRLVLGIALVFWIRSLSGKSGTPAGVLVGLTLITAGAFGNLIDCLFYGMIFGNTVAGAPFDFLFGKVVDMFYFPLWTWPESLPLIGGNIFFSPVFNFADSCVTVGAFYLVIFHWKFFSGAEE